MKNSIILLLLSLVVGCANQQLTHEEIVTSYYNAFNSADYKQIKALVCDSLTITEGDYITVFNHNSYYKHYKWDSIFKPSYNLLALKGVNNGVLATVAAYSVRYKFLKNNPLTCKRKIHFKSGKISKIEILDCNNTNWSIWQKERDSLVNWIAKKHPELDGFIHDLTTEGAQNYLKAIALYKARDN